MLDAPTYIETARREGERIAEIARIADLSAAVPATPGWDLGDLIVHTSGVHRFVTSWMATGEAQQRGAVPEPGDDLVDWYVEGLAALVDQLRAVDPEAEVPTFIGPAPNTFWLRRMAHENAVHRHDAEEVLGDPARIDTEIALDGIDEFLTGFHLPHRVGRRFAGSGETLHFHATDGDGEWFLTRTADGVDVERRHGKADVAARGAAHDLLMFIWGRAGTADLEVFGDDSLLTAWQDTLDP